ncbi:hypothetical protein DJ66_0257 [Candidatus Liberibacter solanacearum]|uniref:Lipoprotein n=1 Tax=Candidatus Liberibacter solanacearum TaxID=556287 RepID=A0A0F4VMC9_9HYPH|nr:hypothetical protein [Candidatus Liberibacter solanacearum]KJZ82648.1 hypothetical protein DJ66_0257 [Candidatus Liberibacter solanacearum]
MDIKKLSLASTIAVLSVTVALGGCNLLRSQEKLKTEKTVNLRSIWKEKSRKVKEASDRLKESKKRKDELLHKYKKEFENNEFVPGLKEAANEEWEIKKEYDKANDEEKKVWDKLSPYCLDRSMVSVALAIATNSSSSG